MQKYLPSKKFQIQVIAILIIIILFVSFRFLFNFIKNKIKERRIEKIQSAVTIKDVIEKDTNNNGISDWEEKLWGKDPNTNGKENREYILAKKAELYKKNENTLIDSNSLNTEGSAKKESEDLSRAFFATIMALQQAGELDEDSMNAIGNSIGDKVIPDEIPDVYTISNIKTIESSSDNISAYYLAFRDLAVKYKDADIGNELTFVAQGLQNNDPQLIAIVGQIAISYQNFAKDLLNIPTPTTISKNAVNLANSYAKTGQSLEQISMGLDNPIKGMQGLLNYKKELDILLTNLSNI